MYEFNIMFAFGRASKRNMRGLKPVVIEILEEAIKISMVDFGIPAGGGLRTTEEQHEMFLDGHSTLDGIHKKSYHQSGFAVDFYAYVDGSANYEHKNMALVMCAIFQAASKIDLEGRSVEWGGFWTKPKDMPHVQLV